MKKNLLLLLLLVLSVLSYQDVDGALLLTDSDFPAVVSEFNYLFVQFSIKRPHSKQIQILDIYNGAKISNPNLRVGKINCMENRKSMQEYGVVAFPTYILFKNGQKIKYTGKQVKDQIVVWLRKRIGAPVVEIDKKKYDQLYFGSTASIVFHGDFPASSQFESLNTRSLANVENMFYWGKDLGSKQGTIEMLKNSSAITYSGLVNQDFDVWFFKYRKGLISKYTMDLSGQIFGDEELKGFVLFDRNKGSILKQFTQAAKSYGKSDVVFAITELDSSEEQRFLSIIKVDPEQYPLVLYEYKTRSKYLMKQPFTKKSILTFLNDPSPYKFPLQTKVTPQTEDEARRQAEQLEKQREKQQKQRQQQKERVLRQKNEKAEAQAKNKAEQKESAKVQQQAVLEPVVQQLQEL